LDTVLFSGPSVRGIPYQQTKFDAEAKRLHLYLDFRKGGRFRCPWLKNVRNLSRSRQRYPDQLPSGQIHPGTMKAYQIKLAFQHFWELSAPQAGRVLDAWVQSGIGK